MLASYREQNTHLAGIEIQVCCTSKSIIIKDGIPDKLVHGNAILASVKTSNAQQFQMLLREKTQKKTRSTIAEGRYRSVNDVPKTLLNYLSLLRWSSFASSA